MPTSIKYPSIIIRKNQVELLLIHFLKKKVELLLMVKYFGLERQQY